MHCLFPEYPFSFCIYSFCPSLIYSFIAALKPATAVSIVGAVDAVFAVAPSSAFASGFVPTFVVKTSIARRTHAGASLGIPHLNKQHYDGSII